MIPETTVEWAPAVAHNQEPATWQALNLPVRRLWMRRGVKRAAQRVEAGELVVVFDNISRALDPTNRLSPWWPNVSARRHVRVRARAQAGRAQETLFRGLTTGFRPRWELGDATVTMTATDARGALADVDAPTSLVARTIRLSAPRWWFPLNDGEVVRNLGSRTTPAVHSNVELNAAPVLLYGSEASAGYGSTGASYTEVKSTDALTRPWSVFAAVCLNQDSVVRTLFAAGPGGNATHPEGHAGIKVLANGTVQAWVINAADGVIRTATSTIRVDTGTPHSILATVSAAGFLTLHVDLYFYNQTGTTVAAVPGAGSTTIGASNQSLGASPFKGRVSHLAVWDRELTFNDAAAFNLALHRPWEDFTLEDRVGLLLDDVGVPAANRLLARAQESPGSFRGGGKLLDAIDRGMATEGGLFFADAGGRLAFYSRGHQGLVGAAWDTRPPAGELPLVGLDIDMDERGFFTVAKPRVATPEPTDLRIEGPTVATYGEVSWEPNTEFRDVARATAGAARVLGDGQPRPHLTGARAIMSADNAVDLLTRDVWDQVRVVGRAPDDAGAGPFMTWDGGAGSFWAGTRGWGGAGAVEQTSRILEVEHDLDGVGRVWATTRTLEPCALAVQTLTATERYFEDGSGAWVAADFAAGDLRVGPPKAIQGAWSKSLQHTTNGSGILYIDKTAGKRNAGASAEALLKSTTTARDAQLVIDFMVGGTAVLSANGPRIRTTVGEATRLWAAGPAPTGGFDVLRLLVIVYDGVLNEEHVLDEVSFWQSEREVR